MVVALDGEQLRERAERQLSELVISRTVDSGGRATLAFADPEYTLFDDEFARIGQELRITIGNRQPTFVGTVAGLTVDHEGDESVPVLRIEARDDAARLATSSDFHAYLGRSIAEVVDGVASRHGLVADVTGGERTEPYLVQTGTDHAFLSSLAYRLGYEWFVRRGQLVFRPRPTSSEAVAELDVTAGSLDRFSASFQHDGHAQPVDVHGWDPGQQQAFVAAADAADETTLVTTGAAADFATEERDRSVANRTRDVRLRLPTAAPRDQEEATALAEAASRELAGSGARFEGVAEGNAAVDAGEVVAVKGVGKRLSGSYYVTEVEHRLDEEGFITVFRSSGAAAPPPSRSDTGLLGDRDAWGRVGFVVGIVTNVGDPDGAGRVKVMFPTLGQEVESDWARLVLPGAGEGRGLDVRPEVGDEVVVGFEHGDPRFPFVLGGVWSSRYPPAEPSVLEGSTPARRTFTSRNGHRLTFSDGPGSRSDTAQQYVEVELADGETRLRIGEDGISVEAPDGSPIAMKAGSSSLTFTDAGDLVIKAKSLDIQVDEKAGVRARELQAESTSKTVLKTNGNLELSGTQVKVDASGIASLKGSLVNIN